MELAVLIDEDGVIVGSDPRDMHWAFDGSMIARGVGFAVGELLTDGTASDPSIAFKRIVDPPARPGRGRFGKRILVAITSAPQD